MPSFWQSKVVVFSFLFWASAKISSKHKTKRYNRKCYESQQHQQQSSWILCTVALLKSSCRLIQFVLFHFSFLISSFRSSSHSTPHTQCRASCFVVILVSFFCISFLFIVVFFAFCLSFSAAVDLRISLLPSFLRFSFSISFCTQLFYSNKCAANYYSSLSTSLTYVNWLRKFGSTCRQSFRDFRERRNVMETNKTNDQIEAHEQNKSARKK